MSWRAFFFGSVTAIALLAALGVYVASQMTNNARLQTQLRQDTSAAEPDPLELLRAENTRLKADVDALPALRADVRRLEQEASAATVQTPEEWSAISNALQKSIATVTNDIAELRQWEMDWRRGKMRELAQARLAEKAEEPAKNPDEEHARLEKAFKQLAATSKRRFELLRLLAQKGIPQADRAGAREEMKALRDQTEPILLALADDIRLYEFMILKPSAEQDPKTVFMQSLVPDLYGSSVTVYLDGTVEWKK